MDFWTLLALAQAGKAVRISMGNSLFEFKGSVLQYSALPDDAEDGDVYYVQSDGITYVYTDSGWQTMPPLIIADGELSSTSENAIQNKVVKAALDGKVSTSSTITNAQIDGLFT